MAKEDALVRTYVGVYGALLAMVGLTTALSFVDLAPFGPAVAMGIAATKSVLVILYFMHVRKASNIIRIFVVVGFYWLALLFGGTLGDLLTRSWLSP